MTALVIIIIAAVDLYFWVQNLRHKLTNKTHVAQNSSRCKSWKAILNYPDNFGSTLHLFRRISCDNDDHVDAWIIPRVCEWRWEYLVIARSVRQGGTRGRPLWMRIDVVLIPKTRGCSPTGRRWRKTSPSPNNATPQIQVHLRSVQLDVFMALKTWCGPRAIHFICSNVCFSTISKSFQGALILSKKMTNFDKHVNWECFVLNAECICKSTWEANVLTYLTMW